MKVIRSRKISVMAGVLALVIILMTFRIPAAMAESWSFVDGDGATGLNYDTSKAASTPFMADLGGSLYAAWAESGGSNGQIRVKKYDSESGTWSTADNDTPLNVNAAKDAQNPVLAVLNGALYAAWQEPGAVYWQVRVKKLTQSGWVSVDGDGPGGLNYNTSNNARNPKLAAYGGALYLFWDEALGSGINQLRVKKYSGSGSAWDQANGGSALNRDTSKAAQLASVAVWNNKLIVGWSEGSTTINVHVKAFNGSTWSFIDGNDDSGLNVDPSRWAQNTDLATDGTSLYIGWSETSAGQNQIYVKKYDGSSWTLLQGITPGFGINQNTTASAYRPRLALVDGTLFASWYEGSPFKIRAKKYVDNAWQSVDGNGAGGLNKDATKAAMYANLASVTDNGAAKLYVAFQENNGTVNQLRVKLMGPDNRAPTASAVSIGGTVKEGNTLTGTYTYADAEQDAEGATTFKWYTADDAAGTGKTVIADATSPTLTLTSAQVGKFIMFEVKPAALTGTATGMPVAYTSATAVVANAAPTASAVSISGTLKEGNTLTGTYTYADAEQDAEGATTFKWYTADDAAGTGKTVIAGETSPTLALTSAQVGKFIMFEVKPAALTGTATGTPVAYTSATAVVANAAPIVSGVHMTGGIKLNQILTGSYTYTDAEGDAEGLPIFRWYAADDAAGLNKTAIAGATGIALELKAAQFGKYVSFEVTPSASAGTTPGNPVESEALGPVGVLKGDANGDGIVSPADALIINKYVAGKLTLTDEQKLMLDMDGDGDVDANDAKLILNIYNGKGA